MHLKLESVTQVTNEKGQILAENDNRVSRGQKLIVPMWAMHQHRSDFSVLK